MHSNPSTKPKSDERSASSHTSVKYHRINSTSSLPLVVPRSSRTHGLARGVKNCALIQPRQWVRFVLVLGDPLVTCLALFGGLLLIGGTLLTSLAQMPMRTALGRIALKDTIGTASAVGPVLIGLGALFLLSSVLNHRMLLRRDRQRRKHKLQKQANSHRSTEHASCPPSIGRSRKLPSAGRRPKEGRRPPLPPSCPTVHQVAVSAVVRQPSACDDGDAPQSASASELR